MASTYTSTFGTSNVRGGSRQTRTNPTRTTKNHATALRQNSLISNPPPSLPGEPTPHGFYPAIQHFADAITALPREYRRHESLLKEVDAKAWQPEKDLQIMLDHCLGDNIPDPASIPTLAIPSVAASVANHDDAQPSAAPSVTGPANDTASQVSNLSAATTATAQRRQLFGLLRQNLIQIMVTMDEKNHVINNANEELTRHVRRLDDVWPHLSDEISEEARLGSLKHWALTDLNGVKKASAGGTAGTNTRRADANSNIMGDNEVAQRSESRREAVAAKSRQRLDRLLGAGEEGEARPTSKKKDKNKLAINDVASDVGSGLAPAKGRKTGKTTAGGVAMEKTLSGLAVGGRAMSREPSQQGGGVGTGKKRKAPAQGAAVARKRYVLHSLFMTNLLTAVSTVSTQRKTHRNSHRRLSQARSAKKHTSVVLPWGR
jgi:hypothetical protein